MKNRGGSLFQNVYLVYLIGKTIMDQVSYCCLDLTSSCTPPRYSH